LAGTSRSESRGIFCYLKDEQTVTIDPLLTNAVGGIKLFAKQEDKAVIEALLIESENNYLCNLVCPECNSKGLELRIIKNEPNTFWGQIKNKVLHGQEKFDTKKYFCKTCGSSIRELPFDLDDTE
jgi:DNA-directed RNA polymerase subunit RPC12/RpoP